MSSTYKLSNAERFKVAKWIEENINIIKGAKPGHKALTAKDVAEMMTTHLELDEDAHPIHYFSIVACAKLAGYEEWPGSRASTSDKGGTLVPNRNIRLMGEKLDAIIQCLHEQHPRFFEQESVQTEGVCDALRWDWDGPEEGED